jgi:hypothetical protein
MGIQANADPQGEQRHGVPDQDGEPPITAPGDERPTSNDEGLQPDPGPAKPHGDPITDIDDEMRSGGGGGD